MWHIYNRRGREWAEVGETCPAGMGMDYERIREGLPVKMPAKQVWETRGWGTWGDGLQLVMTWSHMKNWGNFTTRSPARVRSPWGKEAGERWIEGGRPLCAVLESLDFFSHKRREVIECFNQGNSIISSELWKSHSGSTYGGRNIWGGSSSGDKETS